MDPTTATYYRSILFKDGQDSRTIPPGLMKLHSWTVKRSQALGLGMQVSKQTALAVVMSWFGTKEGKSFIRHNVPELAELFQDPKSSQSSEVDWDFIAVDTPVVAILDGGVQANGTFVSRRSGYIDVKIGNETKAFRTNQVKLASGV